MPPKANETAGRMKKETLEIKDFDFEAGGHLPTLEVVFHHGGNPKGKLVWICHALTANSNPEDWWPHLVGSGKCVDTDSCYVVCVNIPGSPYGSSGPASVNPATGKPFFFDFPAITFRDMVKAAKAVRKYLGIDKIDLIVGSSVGGFQALEWAVDEPEIFRKALFIATAPAVSPWFTAWNEAQRMALEADPTFRAARDLSGGADGLRCARAQALISYRSYEGYRLTQTEPDPDFLFAGRAASYERHQGDKLVNRGFDAYSYYYLCNAIDSHNLGRGRGGIEAALSRIKAKSTIVSVETDGLFPPSEADWWAPMIKGAERKMVRSEFGHDGFLVETEAISAIIKEML